MKELLTYIVQNLVDNPDEVSVTERKSSYSGETVYEVRQGKIVKQIRILMRAVAQRKGKKISVDIIDN